MLHAGAAYATGRRPRRLGAGDVPADLDAGLAASLPASTDEREVLRALRAATEAFFAQAAALDEQLGLDDRPGAELGATMAEYLDLVERRAQR